MSLLLFYGQPPSPQGPEPNWDLHTKVACIADGSYSHRLTGIPEVNDRTFDSGPHRINVDATDIQVAWGGFGRHGTDYPRTIKASVEYNGIVYPMTFDGGSDTVEIGANGREWAVSDPIPYLSVRAGTVLRVRHLVPSGERDGYYLKGDLHSSRSSAGDKTRGGAILGQGQPPRAPMGVFGKTIPGTSKSVAILGDSFIEEGWARGACAENGLAWTDTGVWLESVPRSRGAIDNRLPSDSDWWYDIALCFHSGNDSTLPTEEMKQLHLNYWNMAKGAGVPRVYGITIHPYSHTAKTTDKYTTIEEQTPNTARNIHGFNAWVRDGAPIDTATMTPLDVGAVGARMGEEGHPANGFFDCHAASAIALDSHLWKVDGGAWTTDGAHLTPHGSQMLQVELSKWVADNLT